MIHSPNIPSYVILAFVRPGSGQIDPNSYSIDSIIAIRVNVNFSDRNNGINSSGVTNSITFSETSNLTNYYFYCYNEVTVTNKKM